MTSSAPINERRQVMQWFDNFHKIITYVTGIGVVWLVSTIGTNQDAILLLQKDIQQINEKVINATTDRFTSKDAELMNVKVNFLEWRLEQLEKNVDHVSDRQEKKPDKK